MTNWLNILRACSKDVVADERVANDAYGPRVNAYTPCKAKAEDVAGAPLPRVKTSA